MSSHRSRSILKGVRSLDKVINRDILIKFLKSRLIVFRAHTNVIKITTPQNGGHFERRAAIGRRNTPLINSYDAVSRAQKTSSCLRQ